MRIRLIFAIVASLIAATGSVLADDAAGQRVITTPNGAIYLTNKFETDVLYGEWHFAPIRRVGDFVFLSGIIAGPHQGEANTPDAFMAELRRAFASIGNSLKAAGLSYADIVDLQTFHVFKSPSFAGTKEEHLETFRAVKDEFIHAPYPTWTAIGIESLVADQGLVEIKITAHAPH
jgi:enamine deaminase RidA (YjgF/YER057c/UK114 family)